MTFVQIEKRRGMIHLDGYSRNKTLKGALKDLAREVAKIDEGEGRAISDYIDDVAREVAAGMPNYPDCYIIEAQDVPCASRHKFLNGDENDFSEENVEIEYAEGHWYLYIRFCDPEQEDEEQEAAETESEQPENMVQEAAIKEEEPVTRYEMKCSGDDQFDVMCGDCAIHQIEWWEEVTMEELHEIHAEGLRDDEAYRKGIICTPAEVGWEFTDPDFDRWLQDAIEYGFLRAAA